MFFRVWGDYKCQGDTTVLIVNKEIKIKLIIIIIIASNCIYVKYLIKSA